MDAFLLSRQLSAATNGTDWNILNAYFPQEFALYVVFNASQYTGSIVAINRGMSDEFNCIWLFMHLVRLYVCMHVVENDRVLCNL